MRYCILSDIHGNWEALHAVIEACRKERVDVYLCAGDTLGYGASPRQCLEMLSKLKAISVAGNHDWAVSGKLDFSYFPPDAQAAVNWQRNQIPFEYFNHLNGLELVYKNTDLILVHATLDKPERFHYLNDILEAAETFYLMDRQVCFVGHTHVPRIIVRRGETALYAPMLEIELNPDYKYIVNVGSVGQPRDGSPLTSYCLYDTKAGMIEIKRLQYDVATAQRKILDAGLPDSLANRLAVGE